MRNKIKVSYDERQPNKLLIQKEQTFTSITKAFEFCREIYLSGKSKGKPVIESERAA